MELMRPFYRGTFVCILAIAAGRGTNAVAQHPQDLPQCGGENDWEETAHFNETYDGNGPFGERLTTGTGRLTTGFDQNEWQYVGDGPEFAHEMVFNNGVLEVRHDGPGVDTIGQAQYTRAGSYVQRIEMKNVTLNGPIAGLFSVINLFNTIVGGGDNQLVVQNPFGPNSETWQSFVLNQSAPDFGATGGAVAIIPSGTDIAVEVWFDEPSRTVRYLYDHDTTDGAAAELIATSIFTGPIDECHRDQQLAITSISDGAAVAAAHIDLDNWSYKTLDTLPGDYDGDGDVDGADLLTWQRSFGQTGTGLAADGNGDHLVDQFDLDMWETSLALGLSNNASALSELATIPEPSSVTLLLLALPWLAGRCVASTLTP